MATDAHDLIFKPTELTPGSNSTGDITLGQQQIRITIRTATMHVVSISIESEILANYLATDVNPGTPYVPQYPGSPATKKYVDDSISTAVSSAYKYKGSVASYSNLPASGNTEGDVWNVTDTGMNYAWTGSAWDALGATVDLSNYIAKDNTTAFTPSGDYNPATKKYVDDSVSANNWIDVTVTTAYGTAAKVGTTTAGNYTPTKGDFLLVNFVNGCTVDNPTLNIDGSGAKNIRTGNANANKSTFVLGSTANSNIKALLYYDGTYYRCWSTTDTDTNTTYSGLSVAEGKTGTVTTGRVINAVNLKQIIKYHAVSDTVYDSTWNGETDIAPSQNAVYNKIESLSSSIPSSSATAPSNPTEGQLWYDTTNDVLKVYDGTNWNVVGDDTADINTKTFYLSSTNDLTNAQAAYDWRNAGKNSIIIYSGDTYFQYEKNSEAAFYYKNDNKYESQSGYTLISQPKIKFNLSSGTVVSVSAIVGPEVARFLATNVDYSTPYTPAYPGSPATKKYVDDTVGGAISKGTTAPSSPAEGQLWYDTTNDVLKSYNGTTWVEVGGGIKNNTTGTTSTISQEWAGTKAEFLALNSYSNIIYNIIE